MQKVVSLQGTVPMPQAEGLH